MSQPAARTSDHPQRHRIALLVIAGIGLVIRSIMAGLYTARQIEGLTVSYVESAHHLAAGDPFLVSRGIEILHPYAYSVLILMAESVSNSDATMLATLTGFQVALDTAGIFCMFVAGRNLHSSGAGLAAATVYAVNPMVFLASVQPIPASLSCFLVAALLASVSAVTRDPSSRSWPLWAGLVCGISAQVRSEFLLLAIGVVVYVVGIGLFKREWKRLLALLMVTGIALAPVTIASWIQTGTPRVTSTNGGGTMWQALGEKPDNPWGLKLGDQYVVQEAVRLGLPSAWGPDANDYFVKEWVRAIKEHPRDYAELVVGTRIPHVFNTTIQRWNYVQYAIGLSEFETAKVDYLNGGGDRALLRSNPRLLIVSDRAAHVLKATAWLSYAAFIGYILVNIRRPRRWLLLVLPFLYFVLSLCVIKFVEPRMFFALLPLYCFATGCLAYQATVAARGPLGRVAGLLKRAQG